MVYIALYNESIETLSAIRDTIVESEIGHQNALWIILPDMRVMWASVPASVVNSGTVKKIVNKLDVAITDPKYAKLHYIIIDYCGKEPKLYSVLMSKRSLEMSNATSFRMLDTQDPITLPQDFVNHDWIRYLTSADKADLYQTISYRNKLSPIKYALYRSRLMLLDLTDFILLSGVGNLEIPDFVDNHTYIIFNGEKYFFCLAIDGVTKVICEYAKEELIASGYYMLHEYLKTCRQYKLAKPSSRSVYHHNAINVDDMNHFRIIKVHKINSTVSELTCVFRAMVAVIALPIDDVPVDEFDGYVKLRALHSGKYHHILKLPNLYKDLRPITYTVISSGKLTGKEIYEIAQYRKVTGDTVMKELKSDIRKYNLDAIAVIGKLQDESDLFALHNDVEITTLPHIKYQYAISEEILEGETKNAKLGKEYIND